MLPVPECVFFMEHANDSKLPQKEIGEEKKKKKARNNKQETQKLILINYLGF